MTLTTAQLLETVARETAKAMLATGGMKNAPTAPKLSAATPLPAAKPISPSRRAPLPPDHAQMVVCAHEAGHAVAGVVLGAELRTAVVGRSRVTGLEGLTSFRACPDHAKLRISYSGPWSEAKFRAGGRRPSQREFYAAMDGHGFHNQRALVAAGGTHLGADVQPLLDRCWPAVLSVAKTLYTAGEVGHETVCATLGISDGGGYYSAQLASLRSGGRVQSACA